MNVKQAKAERDKILKQKTVSVSRLKRVLDVLDYDKLHTENMQKDKKILRQRKSYVKAMERIEKLQRK